MDLASVDATLSRFRATVALMSTNLVDLENDAGRARLDQAPLTGSTAQRWREAHAELVCLWQWFTQLTEILDKATELRGTRARLDSGPLAQLDWLVNGPSIELSKTDVPLAQRGLFGPTETTIRCSPPELLDRMRTAFDHAVAVIGDCTGKWAALEGKLQPVEAQLAEAERLGTALGEQHQPELDAVRAQLEGLRQSVACDPLAAPGDSLDAMAATLRCVSDDLRRLAQLKDGLSGRLADAHAMVADLGAAVAAAGEARDEAMAKIAHPAVVDPPRGVEGFQPELAQIEGRAAGGEWRAAAGALESWTARCRDARAAAERALESNRSPIAARNELRGRLDAYRAKAYRLGRLEDPVVAGLHAQAQAALFTAPTDLDQAEILVRRYQQVLTDQAPREVAG